MKMNSDKAFAICGAIILIALAWWVLRGVG
jgi:hypothetical protein